LELLSEFKTCFYNTDELIIPNIYESRDTKEDKKKMSSKILIDSIDHSNKIDGENFEKTLDLINQWDRDNKF
jgi:UDP-N-acetylmuramate-alanine ligase